MGGAVALAIGLKLVLYAAASPQPFGVAMCQWDCGWYLSIIRDGYDEAARYVANCCWQANWAFFPLLPLLVRAAQAVVPADPALLGVLVSTGCFFIFVLVMARLRSITRQDSSPWLWPAFILCWPFGFYFHTIYTEALFAMLAAAALLALAERRMLAAGFATALLTATRPTGILLAAWIGVVQLRAAIAAPSWPLRMRALLAAAIAPLGLLAFMAFLHIKLGDALAFQSIQAGWGRSAANPFLVLAQPFAAWLNGVADWNELFFAAWAILGFAATGWLLWQRRHAEAWLCGMPVIIALSSGTLISMPRFVSTNPAFLLAACDVFGLVRPRWLRLLILAAMLALQACLLFAWWRSPRFLM